MIYLSVLTFVAQECSVLVLEIYRPVEFRSNTHGSHIQSTPKGLQYLGQVMGGAKLSRVVDLQDWAVENIRDPRKSTNIVY